MDAKLAEDGVEIGPKLVGGPGLAGGPAQRGGPAFSGGPAFGDATVFGGGPGFDGGPAQDGRSASAAVALKEASAKAPLAEAHSKTARPPTRVNPRPFDAIRTTALLSPQEETRLVQCRLNDARKPQTG
jgi:hypothetical protein